MQKGTNITWTDPEAEELEKLWNKGFTKKEIAVILNKRYYQVTGKIETMMLNKPRSQQRLSSNQENDLIKYRKNGLTIRQCAKLLGTSITSTHRYIKKSESKSLSI